VCMATSGVIRDAKTIASILWLDHAEMAQKWRS
jgi:hypothetical protein